MLGHSRMAHGLYGITPSIGREPGLAQQLRDSLEGALGRNHDTIHELTVLTQPPSVLSLTTWTSEGEADDDAQEELFLMNRGLHWLSTDLAMPPAAAILLVDSDLDWDLINEGLKALPDPTTVEDGHQIARMFNHLAACLVCQRSSGHPEADMGLMALVGMFEQMPDDLRNRTIAAVWNPASESVMQELLDLLASKGDDRLHKLLASAQQAQFDFAHLDANAAAALDKLCQMAHLPPARRTTDVLPMPAHEYPAAVATMAEDRLEVSFALPALMTHDERLADMLLKHLGTSLKDLRPAFGSIRFTASNPPFIMLSTHGNAQVLASETYKIIQSVHHLITRWGMPAESAVWLTQFDMDWTGISKGMQVLHAGPSTLSDCFDVIHMVSGFAACLAVHAHKMTDQAKGCIPAVLDIIGKLPADSRRQTIPRILAGYGQFYLTGFLRSLHPSQSNRFWKMLADVRDEQLTAQNPDPQIAPYLNDWLEAAKWADIL